MGFEVDFLGERVGRVMVGFMGKMKKQKVIHGPHATPSHHGPPPLPLAAMPGRRTGPCRKPRTSETMAIHPGPRTSTERPAAITMLGQMDPAAAEFEENSSCDDSTRWKCGTRESAIGSGKLLLYTVWHQFQLRPKLSISLLHLVRRNTVGMCSIQGTPSSNSIISFEL
ncbi:uncharacterized protein [Aegilops tauschii subsp. strangulata]|uniref:Uncharacterized protein n=1 Tax=Aegilops tauschii subsp. strangulata TaxID=200361 RepID=A0A453T7F5_AEGTS|nr:uncharacterized protein LOC109732629 [Aegilops tauschii subsp. strangulata]